MKRLARGAPVDAQRADRLPDRHNRVAVVVDVQGVAFGADFDGEIAGRLGPIAKGDRDFPAGEQVHGLRAAAAAVNQQFNRLTRTRLAAEVLQPRLDAKRLPRHGQRVGCAKVDHGRVFRIALTKIDHHERGRLGEGLALSAEFAHGRRV